MEADASAKAGACLSDARWFYLPAMEPRADNIRVMVVEDDPKVCREVSTLIRTSPGFQLAGAYGRVDHALASLAADRPHVVVLDLRFNGANGFDFLGICRARHPRIEVLAYTVHDDPDWIYRAMEAGATGYVLKNQSEQGLLEAIKTLHEGGSFMSSQVARLVLRHFQNDRVATERLAQLSPAERRVLEQLARGLKYAEIAKALGIGVRTVNSHLHHIYEKLHVTTATAAVAAYFRHRS